MEFKKITHTRMLDCFKPYLAQWQLHPEGLIIKTQHSTLLPVSYKGKEAMLKMTQSEEERIGASLMVWWNGKGAACVFEHEANALLMERASMRTSLKDLSLSGQDDEASRIICSVVRQLHAHPPQNYPPKLLPLKTWFRSLKKAAHKEGGFFAQTYHLAEGLLDNQQEKVVLHGDIHHDNILPFSQERWLAVDPKNIIGDRAYDYTNLFLNPNADIALAPGRLKRQLALVAEEAQLAPLRLLQWVIAYAGLSAAWSIEDGGDCHVAMEIAKMGFLEID